MITGRREFSKIQYEIDCELVDYYTVLTKQPKY